MALSVEANRARAKLWYNANIERALARGKRWVEENREHRRAWMREYRRRRRAELRVGLRCGDCGDPLPPRKRLFCDPCSEWHRKNRYRIRLDIPARAS